MSAWKGDEAEHRLELPLGACRMAIRTADDERRPSAERRLDFAIVGPGPSRLGW